MTIALALILLLVGMTVLAACPFPRMPTNRMRLFFQAATVAVISMALMGEGLWMVFNR
ncbi:MAG TPA: hypothetical protein VFG62_22055 [Rhodopila sp.]|jgi:hypothetical protein|nr:hypothetical protein [Rhodopila sp.]